MISLLFPLLFSLSASAFPDLTRHNYFNCTSCHVSPSGGGELNEYGHQLSLELLSHSGTENESKPFYGLLGENSFITPSLMARALQLYTNNVNATEAKAILMQTDLGFTAKYQWLTGVASVGRRRFAPQGAPKEHELFSRTHYLMVSHESGVNIRAGKFMPGYGLNHPNHFLLVRRDEGLMNDTERYNAEISYLGDGFSVLATGIFGPGGDSHGNSKEKGTTFTVNKSLSDSSRLGISYYNALGPTTRRELAGFFGVISWTDAIFSQFQADWQHLRGAGKNQWGVVSSHQLSWEVSKGIVPYIETQWEKLNSNNPDTAYYTYGVGMNWFPRPHWQINALIGKEIPKLLPDTLEAYLMLNLYL